MIAAAFAATAARLANVVCRQLLEAGRGVFKRRLELLVGEFLERLQNFAVIGVYALVSHRFCPLLKPMSSAAGQFLRNLGDVTALEPRDGQLVLARHPLPVGAASVPAP